MALNIKDPETEKFVRELAALTGETVTASADISPNLSASGPRISESGCATTTFW